MAIRETEDLLKKFQYYKIQIKEELTTLEHNEAYNYINENIMNIIDFYIDILNRIVAGEITCPDNIKKTLSNGHDYITEVLEYTLESLKKQ